MNAENKNEVTRIDLENGTVIELVQEPGTHAICEFCNQPVPFHMVRKVLDVPVCIDCLAKEVQQLQNKTTITVGTQTFTIEHVDAPGMNRVLSADFLAKVRKAIEEIKKINNISDNVVIHGPMLSAYTVGLTDRKEYTCNVEVENGKIITNYL